MKVYLCIKLGAKEDNKIFISEINFHCEGVEL